MTAAALDLALPTRLPIGTRVRVCDSAGSPWVSGRIELWRGDWSRCWVAADDGAILGGIPADRLRQVEP